MGLYNRLPRAQRRRRAEGGLGVYYMANTVAKVLLALWAHPTLHGIGHAPATARGRTVTLPAYNNGMCVWRATRCVVVGPLLIANAPMGGFRPFLSIAAAVNYMVTP